MAKDDYFVLIYNILVYLYNQVKSGKPIDPRMLEANSRLVPVNDIYWSFILDNLLEQGFITGIEKHEYIDGTVSYGDLSRCQITHHGISYLFDNNLMAKAKKYLKEIKEITPFI